MKGRQPAGSQPFTTAWTWLRAQADAILSEQVEIAGIAAPPFREEERGRFLRAKLDRIGVATEVDAVGNILALFPATGNGAEFRPVIVAAHIDTVFEPGTKVDVQRRGRRWVGPGIADNARGVAISVSVLGALINGAVRPKHPILFAFTVGEEGRGDLRGVKHLFKEGSPLRQAAAFIAIDGSGLRRIVHRALGCRRFRVEVHGPGGHSWADWGRPNPAHVIGQLAQRLSQVELSRDPRATLTVARLGGGTSVNAIPSENWLELHMRSESPAELDRVEAQFRSQLAQSVAAEEDRAGEKLRARIERIGERPAGKLPSSHPLIEAANEATTVLGRDPEASVSSTDANVPLALGIPAIAIGGGGQSGDTHTVNEWFEDTDGADGALRALSLLAKIARF